MYKSFEFWALVLGGIFAVIGGAMSIRHRIKSDKESKAFQDSLTQKSAEISLMQKQFLQDYKEFDRRITEKNQQLFDLQKEVISIVDGEGIPALYVSFENAKSQLFYDHPSTEQGTKLIFEIRNNSNRPINDIRISFNDNYGRIAYMHKNSESYLKLSSEEMNKIDNSFIIDTKPITLSPEERIVLRQFDLKIPIKDLVYLSGPTTVKVKWGTNNFYDLYYHLLLKNDEWIISNKRFYYKDTHFTEEEFFKKSFERK